MASSARPTNGPNILIFCGGRGSGELANQLLDTGAHVTCCVNAYDDGLSTGRLRLMFDVLGPSDIRKNLLSLMDLDASGYWSRYEVFSYRYPADEEKAESFRSEIEHICEPRAGGRNDAAAEFTRMLERTADDYRAAITRYLRTFLDGLKEAEAKKATGFSFSDAAIGNCILIGALLESGGKWSTAIRVLESLLVTRGRVLLVSEDDRHLFAVCEDGRVLPTEASVITDSDGDIAELFFSPKPVDKSEIDSIIRELGLEAGLNRIRESVHSPVAATDEAKKAIAEADVLMYGSGTFHSSILPTLMIDDVKRAIEANLNPKTMVLNIVEEADTRGFRGVELVASIANFVGKDAVNNVVVNAPATEKGESYFTLTESELVAAGIEARVVRGDLESRTRPGRHEPMLLVDALGGILERRPDTAAQPATQPLVSIVMLAWNRKDDVEIGLREMRKITYPNIEFIVVDNGSIDGTAGLLYEQFPEVNVVRLHTNTGMTGYNVGLATARGKYVIMLDDDSHLASDAVSKMVKAWEQDDNADVGVMAFRVLNPNSGSLVTHLWEERIADVEPGREREITSFAACGAAVRRDVLDKVGYFDDDFFLYATEDDLGIRIWNAGYKIVYEPRCVSYHRESRTMRNWKRYGSGFRNATWFNIKHLPVYMLPLMFVRNIFWLTARGIRFRSFQYFFYGLTGLIKGYLQFSTPLKKRKRVDPKIAKFCLSDNWITRPIFSTSWRIYKDKRYILDKRGVNP